MLVQLGDVGAARSDDAERERQAVGLPGDHAFVVDTASDERGEVLSPDAQGAAGEGADDSIDPLTGTLTEHRSENGSGKNHQSFLFDMAWTAWACMKTRMPTATASVMAMYFHFSRFWSTTATS